jgi:hypothetical protein
VAEHIGTPDRARAKLQSEKRKVSLVAHTAAVNMQTRR